MSVRFEDALTRDGRLVYTCVGNSMLPLLRQKRDLIIIEKNVGRLKKYDVPLYKRDSGQYVLHRIVKVLADGYVLCGDNQWRREFGVTDGQIIGVLTSFVRNGREIRVTDLRYRLYVRLWCGLFFLRTAVLWCAAAPIRLKRRWKRFYERRRRDKNRKNL